ncbi:MAG: zinc ABC transporter substrate-binding protein, partial [Patescibacteria group bacterium]
KVMHSSKSITSSMSKSSKLTATTSFYPLYFFSSQIGGNKVSVKNITPSGAEPHDYEPTAQDVAFIEKSDLLVLNGGSLEAWGDKIKDNLKGTSVVIITASEGLTSQHIEEEGKYIIDPHVWLDPVKAKKEIQTILNGFVKVDSQNKDYYTTNANRLLAQLDALDTKYKNGLMSCGQKDIITSHAAFGYLAKTYGLNQVPISGLSPDAEPSSKQLADVATFAKGHNVKYIFFESLVSPKLSETIANEVGAKTLVLDPIEGVSDGDMKAGKNYLTIMKDNLINLQLALECK